MEDLNIGRGAVEREEAAGGTIFRENDTYNSHKALKWQMPLNAFYCIMATIIFLCTTKVESIEISRHGEIPSLFIGPHQSSKLSPETFVLQVHFFQTQSEMLSEKDIGIYFP